MRRAGAVLSFLVALALPERAHACLTCGNHGDQVATLCVYGAFMLTPFVLAAGIAYVIRRQIAQLDPADATAAQPFPGIASPTVP